MQRKARLAMTIDTCMCIARATISLIGVFLSIRGTLPLAMAFNQLVEVPTRIAESSSWKSRYYTKLVFFRAIFYLFMSMYIIAAEIVYTGNLVTGCLSLTITVLCLVFDCMSVLVRIYIRRSMTQIATRCAKFNAMADRMLCSASVA